MAILDTNRYFLTLLYGSVFFNLGFFKIKLRRLGFFNSFIFGINFFIQQS